MIISMVISLYANIVVRIKILGLCRQVRKERKKFKAGEKEGITAICKWCINKDGSPQNIKYEPCGNTAPDFTFMLNRANIGLEITFSESPEKGHIYVGSRFQKLYEKDEKWINPGDTIVIMIVSLLPIKGQTKCIEKIYDRTKKWYHNGPGISDWDELIVDIKNITIPQVSMNVKLEKKFKDSSTYLPYIFLQSSGFGASAVSLGVQCEYTLRAAISKKWDKCQCFFLNGKNCSLWLAITNVHPILRFDDYVQTASYLNEIAFEHGFEKIFIVDHNIAYELFSRTIKQ